MSVASGLFSELSTFSRDQLSQTTTRVRTRDGKMFEEKRNADGTVQSEFKGAEAAPDYLKGFDDGDGESKLKPRVFEPGMQRWTPLDESGIVIEPSSGRLTLTTYNVWFADCEWETRAHALFAILAQHRPHMICLQEVTFRFLKLLLQEPWLRAQYWVSDATGSSCYPYGVWIAGRVPVSECVIHRMPSNMGRRMVRATVQHSNELISVSTMHLESMDNVELRAAQLLRLFSHLESVALVASSPISTAKMHTIHCGDFNFTDGDLENGLIPDAFLDAWLRLHSVPTATCGSRRLDRVLIKSDRFLCASAHLLGTEPISESSRVGPSDHFGLHCELDPSLQLYHGGRDSD